MKKKAESVKADALLKKLAASSPNDAVKLLFLEQDDLDRLDALDLGLIKEIKRAANGAIELKLIDRLEIIRQLAELDADPDAQAAAQDSFYTALDRAAERLKEKQDAV